jgi:two-component system cell cycle response regulator
VRVLIAEDDAVSRRLLEATLRKLGHEVVVARDGAAAWAILEKDGSPRLAILDWMMPFMDGPQLCREVRKRSGQPYTYILLLTTRDQKQDIVEGMSAGADDYLAKPFDPRELEVRLLAGQRILDLHAALRAQATHDSLTGLQNRAAILDLLQRELFRAKREGSPVGIIMGDLDHFKQINDTYGHPTGDVVLREAARRLVSAFREYDCVGRIGGEEFLIVLPGCDLRSLATRAEALRERVCGAPIETPKGPVPITISLGIAASEAARVQDPHLLLANADKALYLAKSAGRNRVEAVGVQEEVQS